MNKDELKRRLDQEEGLKLEFKQELYKIDSEKGKDRQWNEFIKDILALINGNTNTAGEHGYLIIGAADKLNADGTRDLYDVSLPNDDASFTSTVLDKVNAICSHPLSDLKCETIVIDEKRIVVISIPPSPFLHELTKRIETPRRSFDERTLFIRRSEVIKIATEEERQAIRSEKDRYYKEHRNLWAKLKVFCNNFKNKLTALWQRLQQIPTHWKIVFFIILLVLVGCGITYISQPHTPPAPVTPSKFTILVAGFDGKINNGIRDDLIKKLNPIENRYKDTLVIEDLSGEVVKRGEELNDIKGKYQDKGNVLISAWYSDLIDNFFRLEHRFVLISKVKFINEQEFTDEHKIHSSEDAFYDDKDKFINEMVYLSRFALGMNYYEEGESETEDIKKRIKQFSSASELLDDASDQKLSHEPALDKKLVLCYKGIAYYKQGRIEESSDILKQAQETLKQASSDGSGIKFPEGCPKETNSVFDVSSAMATSSGGGGGGSLMVK